MSGAHYAVGGSLCGEFGWVPLFWFGQPDTLVPYDRLVQYVWKEISDWPQFSLSMTHTSLGTPGEVSPGASLSIPTTTTTLAHADMEDQPVNRRQESSRATMHWRGQSYWYWKHSTHIQQWTKSHQAQTKYLITDISEENEKRRETGSQKSRTEQEPPRWQPWDLCVLFLWKVMSHVKETLHLLQLYCFVYYNENNLCFFKKIGKTCTWKLNKTTCNPARCRSNTC